MVIGYYNFILKQFIIQPLRKYKLRKCNFIGKGCLISKNAILKGSNKIGDLTILGNNVVLEKNVIIGNISRIYNINVGKNSHIESGVICTGYGKGKIKIGNESYIGINNVLDWSDNITIGDYVHIAGPSTGLWTHTSVQMCLNSISLSKKDKKYRPTKPIIIEDNVYIGSNCTIYPGVTIHHHSVVAPNSAVTKDIDSYTMVGGVPAKHIKNIKNKS